MQLRWKVYNEVNSMPSILSDGWIHWEEGKVRTPQARTFKANTNYKSQKHIIYLSYKLLQISGTAAATAITQIHKAKPVTNINNNTENTFIGDRNIECYMRHYCTDLSGPPE